MREIKFRAWIKEDEEMMLEFVDFSNPVIFNLGENDILMQFTDHKDKNDKEIYEGDIVEFEPSNKEKLIGVIQFNEGCFGYMTNKGFYSFPKYIFTKIIGNIYENPKLLK